MEKMTSEIKSSERTLREGDVKRFWIGFQKFRSENSALEMSISGKIAEAGLDGDGEFDDKYNTAIETTTLFIYGATLAKRLRPELTDSFPIPKVEILKDFEGMGHATEHNKDWVCLDTWLSAGLVFIQEPARFYSVHIKSWRNDTQKSVSNYLPDWVIVGVTIAGAEEYGHELFYRLKPPIYHLKQDVKNLTIEAQQEATNNTLGFEASSIVYHTKDIERRGLVWKEAVISKYFPNWGWPTKEFVKEVSRLRLQMAEGYYKR